LSREQQTAQQVYAKAYSANDITNLPEDLNPSDNLEAFREAVKKHS